MIRLMSYGDPESDFVVRPRVWARLGDRAAVDDPHSNPTHLHTNLHYVCVFFLTQALLPLSHTTTPPLLVCEKPQPHNQLVLTHK